MRQIKRLIVHCSDSTWGTASEIEKWHKEFGFDTIGYHYVITNGLLRSSEKYQKDFDGSIQRGRGDAIQGAHVYGHNQDTLGICLIGKTSFTQKQLFHTLPKLLSQLMDKYNLMTRDIFGHYELDDDKTCPSLDMVKYRTFVETTRSPHPQLMDNPGPDK